MKTSLANRVAVLGLNVSIGCLLAASVYSAPPIIPANRQPISQCIINGQNGSLSVGAQGTAPFIYQWQFHGADLPGQTNATLPLRPARPEEGGDYRVVVSNAEGVITSRVARLHVLPPPSSLVAKIFTNSASQRLPYRLWVPTNHLDQAPLPLVIFLHGAGEVGNDNLRQLSVQPYALSVVSYQNQEQHPCFFVAPQCPSGRFWSDNVMVPGLGSLQEELIKQYPIDTNRIYVTGLSMGGYGTWALLLTWPDLYAAAAPICGGGVPNSAAVFKHVPIWNFHSANDGTVPVSNSRQMIDALRRAGGTPLYTEYASAGHGSWVPAYSTPALTEWMMSQRRGNPTAWGPHIDIDSPYTNALLRAQVGHFNLSGNASAFGEEVTNIVWTNLVLRAGGKADATNLWELPDISLGEQVTNLVLITAKTASWSPQYGGATTLSKTLQVRGLPPLELSLIPNGNYHQLFWKGGEPPYLVQMTTDLTSGQWSGFETNAISPLNVPSVNSSAFYRVITP